MNAPQLTRLAPSPTGALHLGNARTFLVNWLLARKLGWNIILRIEDLDGPRVKAGADAMAVEDLKWLGLDWDNEPVYQSTRADKYATALKHLQSNDSVYPQLLSRLEQSRLLSAPHDDVPAATDVTDRSPAWHFRAPATPIAFEDGFAGPQRIALNEDFAVAKADGTTSYQLAVVVDDAAMGVTQVVRGDDLLDSAARQIALFQAMGLADHIPAYTHLPLVVGPDGRRLAKRHGDTRLSHYRILGTTPQRMLALLLRWCGQANVRDDETLQDWPARFELHRLPRGRITFTPADHAFLIA